MSKQEEPRSLDLERVPGNPEPSKKIRKAAYALGPTAQYELWLRTQGLKGEGEKSE